MIVWLLIIGSSLPLTALAADDRYAFRTLDANDGLMQNTIAALHQDHNGFVWIATQGGLHRYDGYQFQLFQHDPSNRHSLPDALISSIAENASTGELFVGTDGAGLANVAPAGNISRLTQKALPRNVSALLHVDGVGLWIGSNQGLQLLDLNGVVSSWLKLEISAQDYVLSLYLDRDGALWVSTAKSGVLRLHNKKLEPISAQIQSALFANQDYAARPVVGFALASDDQFVMAQADQLIWLDQHRMQVQRRFATSDVRAVQFASDQRLWLARGAKGLTQLRTSELDSDKLPALKNVLANDVQVIKLLLDRSGQLWAGTQSTGVLLADTAGVPFRTLASSKSTLSRNIRALASDSEFLYIATLDGQLQRYQYQANNSNLLRNEENALDVSILSPVIDAALGASGYRIHSMLHTKSAIWLGTSVGVAFYDPVSNQAKKLSSISDDSQIRSMIRASDGSIWLGGNTGLFHMDETGQLLASQNEPSTPAMGMVLAIFEDAQNRLWVGTREGLWLRDNNAKWRHFSADEDNPRSLTGDIVRSILQSKDGSIWIGTHSGLARLDQLDERAAEFSRYTVRDGLPSATVYCIVEDRIGQLWLSGNRGLVSFLPRSNQWRAFDQQEGLSNLEFNGGACMELPDGMLLFGGVNGTTYFAPELADRSEFNAPVRLLDARIGSSRRAVDTSSTAFLVPYDGRVIDLQFAALDFRAPARNRFAYKLEGFDSNWVFGRGMGRATYTNLSPGKYTLHLRGSNRDERWSNQELKLSVVVQAPVWQSKPVIAAGTVLSCALVTAMLWSRRRRIQTEQKLNRVIREREDRLRLSLWGSRDMYWDYEHNSQTLRRAETMATLGIPGEGSFAIAEYFKTQVHPEDVPAILRALAQANSGSTNEISFQHRLKNAVGDWTWVAARGQVVQRDRDGQVLRVAGTAHNIDKSRADERDLRVSARVLDRMSEAVAISTDEGVIIKVNAAFEQMIGFTAEQALGAARTLIHSNRHGENQYKAIEQIVLRDGRWKGEMWLKRAGGDDFLASVEINRVEGLVGEAPIWVTVFSDITDRKLAEEELRFLANFDSLTGLPNRSMLLQRLQRAIARAKRHQDHVALLFIDLDRFKHINDSLGHAAGDELLRGVADRLRQVVREIDTTARLAGDEFVLLIEELPTSKDAMQSAERVLRHFVEPFEIQGSHIVISPSIGVAVFPDDAQTPDDLIKCGDLAMYEAKSAGRNTIRTYTSKQSEAALERAATESLLKRAMDREQFELHYQPVYALTDHQPRMVEALLRWRHPTRGVVAPDSFIPILEESGLIVPIGLWVIGQALQQLKRWDAMGISHMRVSVNVSMLQIARSDLMSDLANLLARYQIEAERLTLELTESMVMANPEQAIATLNKISDLGVQLAIDDFGTGYSSLSYLKRLPIDKLKIDKSFVSDLVSDADGKAIAASIIAIAKTLQLQVTAEGVETEEQLRALAALQCDEAQGYYFSRPLDADACTQLLQETINSTNVNNQTT